MTQASRSERGFTLVELLVVLLVIAILAGIAIPLLLGATNSAQNRVARSVVVATVVATERVYHEYGDFPATWSTSDWRAALASALPSTITLTTGSPTSAQQVSYDAATDYFAAAADSGSGGQCAVAVYDPVPGTNSWGSQGGTFVAQVAVSSPSACSAQLADETDSSGGYLIPSSSWAPIVGSSKIMGYTG